MAWVFGGFQEGSQAHPCTPPSVLAHVEIWTRSVATVNFSFS